METKINAFTTLNVLSLEDSVPDFEMICIQLTRAGYDLKIFRVEKEKEFAALLKKNKYDIILADFNLPGFDAFGALRLCNQICPNVPFICVSGSVGEETAIELLKLGAVDYVLKDRSERLPFAVHRALEGVALQKERNMAEAEKLKILNELQVNQVELELQNHELIQAKEQASIAAEKYIELYDFAPSGYFSLSPKGEILELNLTGAKMMGKDRSQLKNRMFHLFISNYSKQVFLLFLEKVLNSNTKESCELTLSSNANPPLVIQLTGIASENDANYFITAVDITERKQAEEALKASEEKYRAIADNGFEGLVIVNFEGTVIFANQSLIKIFEYDNLEELIGTNVFQYISEESIPQAIDDLTRVAQGEIMDVMEYGGVTSKGRKIFFESIGKIIEYEGIKADIISVRDITQWKHAQQEILDAKEKAEESDRLKSAFLANISHEIRTPMNGILGFIELLKEPDLTGEEQQEYFQIIEKSGERMVNIINDIVDLSKIESGQMKVSMSETNVNEQIEFIYNLFRQDAEKKGLPISIENSLQKNDAIIKTDKEKLFAILSNLVKNAIKFTKTGYIKVGCVSTSSPTGQHELQFFVKDTGIGIRHEQQEFIFERFRQGSESLNKKYEGAGLGLSISKAYVEKLSGKIWVESEEGRGSIFYFTLPYNEIPEVKKDNTIHDQGVGEMNPVKKLKILIADDDEGSSKFLALILRHNSKEIIKAKNGVEAVNACLNNPDIDLVLMDIQMPEMDGYEATRQIRQFNKDVIIIAQTAFALSGDNEKAIAAGCNDYISKPIQKDQMMGLVEKYFK